VIIHDSIYASLTSWALYIALQQSTPIFNGEIVYYDVCFRLNYYGEYLLRVFHVDYFTHIWFIIKFTFTFF